jgi:hypothetical protein
VHDAAMGPETPRSTVLLVEEEAMVIAFRKRTLLALDDGLYALQASISHVTRSSLQPAFSEAACQVAKQAQQSGKFPASPVWAGPRPP